MTDRPLEMVSPALGRHTASIAGAILVISCLSVGPADAGETAGLHSAWRGCLHRSFGLQVAMTSKTLAADTALRACRGTEEAYLSALSTSPLVDGEDVARVRPALLQRARGWLLGGHASRPL